jgi:hypothetical protein
LCIEKKKKKKKPPPSEALKASRRNSKDLIGLTTEDEESHMNESNEDPKTNNTRRKSAPVIQPRRDPRIIGSTSDLKVANRDSDASDSESVRANLVKSSKSSSRPVLNPLKSKQGGALDSEGRSGSRSALRGSSNTLSTSKHNLKRSNSGSTKKSSGNLISNFNFNDNESPNSREREIKSKHNVTAEILSKGRSISGAASIIRSQGIYGPWDGPSKSDIQEPPRTPVLRGAVQLPPIEGSMLNTTREPPASSEKSSKHPPGVGSLNSGSKSNLKLQDDHPSHRRAISETRNVTGNQTPVSVSPFPQQMANQPRLSSDSAKEQNLQSERIGRMNQDIQNFTNQHELSIDRYMEGSEDAAWESNKVYPIDGNQPNAQVKDMYSDPALQFDDQGNVVESSIPKYLTPAEVRDRMLLYAEKNSLSALAGPLSMGKRSRQISENGSTVSDFEGKAWRPNGMAVVKLDEFLANS